MDGSGWIRKAVRAGAAAINIFLGLVLAAGVWMILSKFWLKTEIPSVLGYAPVYVLSGSMEPTFSAGDMIIIHLKDQYEPGDVVTFYSDGELVTHRIVGESAEGFTVKGDANNVRDEEPVSRADVVGKLVFVLPHAGSAASFFRTPQGLIILAALLLLTMRESRRGGGTKREYE